MTQSALLVFVARPVQIFTGHAKLATLEPGKPFFIKLSGSRRRLIEAQLPPDARVEIVTLH